MIGAAHVIELSFGGSLELLHAIHENIISLFCFGSVTAVFIKLFTLRFLPLNRRAGAL